jgi:hypothetical protein
VVATPGVVKLAGCGCCGGPSDCCERILFNPLWLPKVCVCFKCPRIHATGFQDPVTGFKYVYDIWSTPDPDAAWQCVTLYQQYIDYPANTEPALSWADVPADGSGIVTPIPVNTSVGCGDPYWRIAGGVKRDGGDYICPGDITTPTEEIVDYVIANGDWPYPYPIGNGFFGMSIPVVATRCPYGPIDPTTGRIVDGTLIVQYDPPAALYVKETSGSVVPASDKYILRIYSGECPGGGFPGGVGSAGRTTAPAREPRTPCVHEGPLVEECPVKDEGRHLRVCLYEGHDFDRCLRNAEPRKDLRGEAMNCSRCPHYKS